MTSALIDLRHMDKCLAMLLFGFYMILQTKFYALKVCITTQ